MRSLGLGQIVQSNSSRFKPGDIVYGIILWGTTLFWKTLHCITVLIRRSDYHWSIIFLFWE